MKFHETLKKEEIRHLPLLPPFCVEEETPLPTVIKSLQERKWGSVLILRKGKLAGILTEQDILAKVALLPSLPQKPIGDFVTANPLFLKITDSIAKAIQTMIKGGFRHLPIVDEKGELCGYVTTRALIKYLAEHFPYEVYNLPPDPNQTNKEREGA
ncbi:MAG: CBS domain-containing protein [bacterium]|nr:CBS domain-containing protein [bacterium]